MVNIASFAKFLMEDKSEYCLIDVLLGIVGERGSSILNVSICFYSEIFKIFFHNSQCVHPLVYKFMAHLTENILRFIVVCQKLIRRLKMS